MLRPNCGEWNMLLLPKIRWESDHCTCVGSEWQCSTGLWSWYYSTWTPETHSLMCRSSGHSAALSVARTGPGAMLEQQRVTWCGERCWHRDAAGHWSPPAPDTYDPNFRTIIWAGADTVTRAGTCHSATAGRGKPIVYTLGLLGWIIIFQFTG